jgi:hypothetical protein
MNRPVKPPKIMFPTTIYGLLRTIAVYIEPKVPEIIPPTGPYIIAAKNIRYWKK